MTPEPFNFAVLSDLHYLAPECCPWLAGIIRDINALDGLELVLVLGDLAEVGSLAELSAAKQILDTLRVPYYPVPGNHDGPPDRPIGIGEAGLADYLRLFPGTRNYTFTHKGWQFLALDTTNGSGWKEVPMPPDTQAFARQAARTLDPAAPTILFTHFPLDPTVPFSMAGGHDLLDILRPLNLRIVFSGHYHGFSENRAPRQPDLRLLTSRCASRTREVHDNSNQRGYLRCRANADQRVDYAFVHYTGPR